MRIVNRLNRKIEKIKDFFQLYTSGLNHQEIEHLLKEDTVGAFSYLKRKTSISDQTMKRHSPRSMVFVCKEIFISFIMKLTPARRFFYGIAIVGFLLGMVKRDQFYIFSAFVILNLLLALELVDKLTTRDELEIAREIQLSLQPRHIPDTNLLSISTYYRPARVVGGDFFDIVQPNGDCLISIVGDVSDKGISAALVAAYAQSMFQSLSEVSASPAEIFRGINNLISRRLRDGDFITAVIALFDLKHKSVTIARAGHNWPLFYHADSGRIEPLKPKGVSIGLCDNEAFCSGMDEYKLFLNPGDLLMLYSDGVTEATNPQKKMFDITGLQHAIMENVQQDGDWIIENINARLQQFVQSDEIQDDTTMVAIKVK